MPTETQVRDHPIQTAEDLQSALIETGIPVDVGDLEHPPPRHVVKKRERERAVKVWNEAVELYEEEGEAGFEQHLERKTERIERLSAKVDKLEDRLHEKRITRDMAADRVQDGEEDEVLDQEARNLPGPTPNAYASTETWGEVLKRAREECWEYEGKLDASRDRLHEVQFKCDILHLIRRLYEQGHTPSRVGLVDYEPSEGAKEVLNSLVSLINGPKDIDRLSSPTGFYRLVSQDLGRDSPKNTRDALHKDLSRKDFEHLKPEDPQDVISLARKWEALHTRRHASSPDSERSV